MFHEKESTGKNSAITNAVDRRQNSRKRIPVDVAQLLYGLYAMISDFGVSFTIDTSDFVI